jgi:acyl-CoA reductase-like NAD-dependent aldehyde dehydrogenase
MLSGLGHLVGGKIITDGDTFEVFDPATDTLAATCPAASLALIDQAMEAAAAAQPSWAVTELAERRRALTAIADVLERESEGLADLVALETGKPIADARFEVQAAAGGARYWAQAEIPVDVIYDDATQRVTLERVPVGVVAAIVPWNAPLALVVLKSSTALLVGDAVVVKPSPFTPLSALAFGSLVRDLLPPGVLNIIAGGDDVGAAMVRHPTTSLVSFTGSAQAGRAIMADAAAGLKRVGLELGGNDAAIVLGDADPAEVASALFQAAFMWTGQVCAAIKRLYVHRSIFEPTVAALADLARQAQLGGPYEDGVTMGPVSTRPQFERVVGLVEDAVAAGAVVHAGGAPLHRPGLFFAPTVLTGVGAGVRVVDEEQFGPVLPVMAFDDVEWAIAQANDTSFGLGASVWSSDVAMATTIARRLEAGSTWVNRHAVAGADLPFGGIKQSGLGRENGAIGLDHFCELRTVSVAL